MTRARPSEKAIVQQMRHELAERGFHYFDPALKVGEHSLLAEQEIDFLEMGSCDGLVAVWTPTAYLSYGVCAELEWARRHFKLPFRVWKPGPAQMSEWTKCTIGNRLRTAIGMVFDPDFYEKLEYR